MENIDSKIQRMIKIESPQKLFKIAAEKMMWSVKVQYPEVLDGVDEKIFKEELKIMLNNSYLDTYTPLYKTIYTEKEIDAFLNFYSGKIGKSLIRKKLLIKEQDQKYSSKFGERISDIIAEGFKSLDSLKFNFNNCSCQGAKKGKFLIKESNGDSIYIERIKDKQIVNVLEEVTEYRIIWITKCSYQLTPLKKIKSNSKPKLDGISGLYNIYWSSNDDIFYEIKKNINNNYKKNKLMKIE